MIPAFCLTRLNQSYQETIMTCKTPCKNCKCDDPLANADLTTPLSRQMNEEIIRILAEGANKEQN